MRQVTLTGKIKNVNFGFNAIYSSPTSNNDNVNETNDNQLLKEKNCSSSSISSTAAAAAASSSSKLSKRGRSKKLLKTNQQGEEERMPTHRRKVRNAEQRRKMKLHNRKDDIPDCDTLEIIDFDENAENSAANISASNSDSDASSRKESTRKSSTGSFHSPLPEPETRVSLTDANNNVDNGKIDHHNNNINDRSFQSCATSSAYGGYDQTASTSSSAAPSSKSSSVCGESTASKVSSATRRRREKRRREKHRRHRNEKPSALMKFGKSLLENLGQVLSELFVFLCSVLKIDGGNRATPLSCILLLFLACVFISYIEISFAGMIEIFFQWLWPTIHICLRIIERFFKGIGNTFAGLDDLAESSYCDMASMWCDYFNLMCSSRCSFTKLALERIRG